VRTCPYSKPANLKRPGWTCLTTKGVLYILLLFYIVDAGELDQIGLF